MNATSIEGTALRGADGRSEFGTIEERNGRFRLRVRVAGQLETISTHDDYDSAELARLAYAKAASNEGEALGMGLAAYGYAVIDARETDGTTSDAENERSRWKNHVEGDVIVDARGRPQPGLGALAVGDWGEEDVRDWTKRLRVVKGLSESTQRHCLHLLTAVWRAAYEDKPRRHAGPNPCAEIKIRRDKRTHEPEVFLTPEEQDRLVATAASMIGCEEAIVDFAIGSGLRAGEIVTLHLEDVHLEASPPYVDVRYSLEENRPTKSGKPRRVYLLEKDRAALERWLAALPAFCRKNPRKLVFPGKRGGLRSQHVLRWEQWKGFAERGTPGEAKYRARIVGMVERAGLPSRLRWHDLRHTCASALLNGWWGSAWTLAEIQARLGHESAETTMRYAHIADDAQKKAAVRSQVRSHGDSPSSEIPSDIAGAGHRIRTGDIRLGKPELKTSVSSTSTRLGTGLGTARSLLEAIERRASAAQLEELAEALASEILGAPAVALARQVMREGPGAMTAAIELAELVVGGQESEVARASGDDR